MKQYRAIFEKAAEGILVAELESKRFRYANPAICKMLGYTEDELLCMGVADIHPKEFLENVMVFFNRQATCEKITEIELPCLHKDGTVLNVNISTSQINIDNVPCNLGFFTDITGRKQAEEALRQSEERYRVLTETANDAIITANRQRCIVSWNHGAEKIYGYKAKEIIGKDCVLIMPEDQRKLHKEFFTKVINTGKPINSDMVLEGLGRRKDGSEFPAEQNFNLYWINKEPFFTIIVRDVSRRKEIEKSLHESEELFRLSFENAPTSISIYNNKGELLQINKACEQCFGRSKEDIMQHGLSRFMHPDDKQKTIETINTIMSDHEKHGLSKVLENRFYAPDGHTIYTRQCIQGCFDTNGDLSFVVILTEDVTAAKQLTLMNTAIVNKLKDVHLQLNEFSSLMANDQNFLATKSLSDYGLSPMETRITSMIFHGNSNKKIAHELCISENTVKHHITSIYSKFKVKNRIGFLNTIRTNRIII